MSDAEATQDDHYILGISAFYHDAACALIRDGEIVAAAQEERFTRVKNDSSFPMRAINFCLEQARIHVEGLSAIVFYDNPMLTFERIVSSHLAVAPRGKEAWQEMVPRWVQTKLRIPEIIRGNLGFQGPIHFMDHHVSHAASAYIPSPFDESAILTMDGVGEWATASIGHGQENSIRLLKQMTYPDSLGLLYSALTSYVGFKVNSGEYKLMGLAPYGEPKYVDLIKDNLLQINDDGSIRLNQTYFAYMHEMKMTNEAFHSLFGGPPRSPVDPVQQREMDIAKSIQVVTEEVVLKMAAHAKEITGSRNLCLSGGVALNCVANGRLVREGGFDDIWIQPAAGDAGSALGAAMYLHYVVEGNERRPTDDGRSMQKGSYWGPDFSNDEISDYLDSYSYVYTRIDDGERGRTIAAYLDEGKVVGHFSGRLEFGPRALGSRSILGDPRNRDTQSILNLKIKYRESFRPFAPTVLEEDMKEYFEIETISPHMLLVDRVREDRCLETEPAADIFERVNQARSDLPAITHVDYSARIQSIQHKDHPAYVDVIEAFKERTGCSVIVNTSFNVRGEPIVCTPHDAVNCFMNTEMDVLVLENCLLEKTQQTEAAVYVSQSFTESDDIEVVEEPEFSLVETLREWVHRRSPNHPAKLFDKYLLPIRSRVTCPIEMDFKASPASSNWSEYPETEYYHEAPSFRDVDSEVEYILSFWRSYSEADKEHWKSLLATLIQLKNRQRDQRDTADAGDVSDNIYVMH